MYRILKASRDTYITDRIIRNRFRATDANVGQAGTLDLFKLYDESTLSGTTTPTEISRLLVKFDLDPLRALTGSIFSPGNSTFRALLQLTDVYGGNVTPSNFYAQVIPLSMSFDEGVGRDIVLFQDVDASNWITSSISNGTAIAWNVSGAAGEGVLGSNNIDIIMSGNLSDGQGIVNLWTSQLFESGEEDLSVDVTTVISGVLANQIPDHGFMIRFLPSHETDQNTYFVKRFASRHSTQSRYRPKIIATFDDTLRDDHGNFFFDTSGSLFLNYFSRGTPANAVSGSALAQLTGSNCMLLTLISGTFSQSFTASQHRITGGGNYVTGVYSASFAVPSSNSLLSAEIVSAGSGTFTEIWSSLDRTVGYLTGTVVIRSPYASAFNGTTRNINVNIENLKTSYVLAEHPRLRVSAYDMNYTPKYVKIPLITPSQIFENMYYQIRDGISGDIIIPFDSTTGSTRLSTDKDGMYFDLFMSDFDVGRVYTVEFLIEDRGNEYVFAKQGSRFRIEP